MPMDFQILDADYEVIYDSNPVIRLFGRGADGKSVCCFVPGFEPYFYLKASGDLHAVARLIKETFAQVKKVEIVEKFEPIGYQKTKKEMLKITTHLPRDVPEIRDDILKLQEVMRAEGKWEVYETDILFRNRFLIDKNLGGMVWLSAEGAPVDPVKYFRGGNSGSSRCENFACDSSILASGFKKIENFTIAPLKYLSFDIECLPLDGGMPSPDVSPIIMISFSFEPEYRGHKTLVLLAKPAEGINSDVLPCKDETEMLNRFFEIFCEYDPDIVAGYNHQDFDIPYITDRVRALAAQGKAINPVVGRDGSKIGYRRFGLLTRTEIKGRVVVDALPLVRRAFSLKQYTLRAVSKELLNREKLDVPPLEMEEYWFDTGEKFRKFVDYARRDAELALELILNLRLLDKYIALAQVSGSLLQEIVDGGQTSMVETLLLREFGRRDRVLLPKPDDEVSAERYEMSSDLKGGEVLEPKKGLLENVIILDYKSLYPTIMMAHNLCYSTVVTGDRPDGATIKPPSGGEFVPPDVYKGIVPSILEDLLNQRSLTKKRMRSTSDENEYRVLDATQLAVKILLNSFYGYSGYARARLYNLTLANAVTSFGRSNILNTRDIINTIGKIVLRNGAALLLEEAGELSPHDKVVELSVAYGDTDSVFVHCQSTEDLSLEEVSLVGNRLSNIVSASLPDPMELEFESIAKRALLIAKKRYALWLFEPRNSGWEDKIKVKGMETVRRDWCELTSVTLNRVLELVLKEGDVDRAVEHVRKVVNDVRNLDPAKDSQIIESLILTRTLTRKLESYKNKQPHLTVAEKLKERTGVMPSIGTRIPFIITAGKGLFVDRAEDPDYVREHNIPIDVDYYIKKQILPPVERILEVLGVKLSSLDFDSKQKGLFDFEAKKPEKMKQEKPRPKKENNEKPKEQNLFKENGRVGQSSLFDF
ncbi:MAG: DNA-directed DNA polymerase [Methanosarcina thermophila]|uniref:DNA polymerase n=4 Tax=Methanosarcina thermophila TaxID=2210 RepID=A0A3G9CSW0_METTE|nr:DNA-directed DNA polymerase [Methanosarcina thermophila]ALK04390.1 MAG: DNA polymerase [Methanosarcina sp. 795]AKB13005.1 Archaeal DNA polymerase I [Methanosarcina thermophila TM-1]NLU56490.1 DNA polymerase elongation subunit [Methanosarcina thermophila]BAW27989.1 replicative DNA polymerase I [Methanosarcina thermophila]GLI14437.1 DNA polymerase elongation subunit [Methanosarcina thermophila MST-A1]